MAEIKCVNGCKVTLWGVTGMSSLNSRGKIGDFEIARLVWSPKSLFMQLFRHIFKGFRESSPISKNCGHVPVCMPPNTWLFNNLTASLSSVQLCISNIHQKPLHFIMLIYSSVSLAIIKDNIFDYFSTSFVFKWGRANLVEMYICLRHHLRVSHLIFFFEVKCPE